VAARRLKARPSARLRIGRNSDKRGTARLHDKGVLLQFTCLAMDDTLEPIGQYARSFSRVAFISSALIVATSPDRLLARTS